MREFFKSNALRRAEEEVERLREENRHLLNALLRQAGVPAVGQEAEKLTSTAPKSRARILAEREANAWREWDESFAAVSKTAGD